MTFHNRLQNKNGTSCRKPSGDFVLLAPKLETLRFGGLAKAKVKVIEEHERKYFVVIGKPFP